MFTEVLFAVSHEVTKQLNLCHLRTVMSRYIAHTFKFKSFYHMITSQRLRTLSELVNVSIAFLVAVLNKFMQF